MSKYLLVRKIATMMAASGYSSSFCFPYSEVLNMFLFPLVIIQSLCLQVSHEDDLQYWFHG